MNTRAAGISQECLPPFIRRRSCTIERALTSIQIDWIDNECTMQQMAFMPATGEMMVIGLEDQEPVAIGGVR